MNETILNFLSQNHIAVLATLLPDGFPHAASLHFSHSDDPLTLYFSTENTSRKCQGLLNGETVKASVVVGFSETEWKTIQLDGVVRAITDQAELENAWAIHYAKHPTAEKYKNEPETIFLAFTPVWWRYTDYNTEPATFVTSETV